MRMRADVKGLVRREEVERCIRKVMDGEGKDEYRRNATKWMEMAKEAMQEGGSSDKNIAECQLFIDKVDGDGQRGNAGRREFG